jgi:hypothetical protein
LKDVLEWTLRCIPVSVTTSTSRVRALVPDAVIACAESARPWA